ncbi:hypothetical protein FACS18949_02580 [Clostridia bacterium]|nr:hypothetical protein FACS18949_02580 [Clostridia bacterium]
MKNKVIIALSSAAFFVLLIALSIVIASAFGSKRSTLSLPPDPAFSGALPTALNPGVTPYPPESDAIEISPENVKKIIQDLKRPDNYACSVTLTLFWDGLNSSETRKLYVNGDRQRVESAYSVEISSSDGSYRWQPGSETWTYFPRGDFNADASALTPTYSDVLKLDKIDGAAYVTVDGLNCVWLKNIDNTDIWEYWVDLATGLLASASYTEEGKPAWRFAMTDLTLGSVSDEFFKLVDGTTVLDD